MRPEDFVEWFRGFADTVAPPDDVQWATIRLALSEVETTPNRVQRVQPGRRPAPTVTSGGKSRQRGKADNG